MFYLNDSQQKGIHTEWWQSYLCRSNFEIDTVLYFFFSRWTSKKIIGTVSIWETTFFFSKDTWNIFPKKKYDQSIHKTSLRVESFLNCWFRNSRKNIHISQLSHHNNLMSIEKPWRGCEILIRSLWRNTCTVEYVNVVWKSQKPQEGFKILIWWQWCTIFNAECTEIIKSINFQKEENKHLQKKIYISKKREDNFKLQSIIKKNNNFLFFFFCKITIR